MGLWAHIMPFIPRLYTLYMVSTLWEYTNRVRLMFGTFHFISIRFVGLCFVLFCFALFRQVPHMSLICPAVQYLIVYIISYSKYEIRRILFCLSGDLSSDVCALYECVRACTLCNGVCFNTNVTLAFGPFRLSEIQTHVCTMPNCFTAYFTGYDLKCFWRSKHNNNTNTNDDDPTYSINSNMPRYTSKQSAQYDYYRWNPAEIVSIRLSFTVYTHTAKLVKDRLRFLNKPNVCVWYAQSLYTQSIYLYINTARVEM